jgi:hypothetical protein
MMKIAQTQEYDLILNYRDSLNHTLKEYSVESNYVPGDIIINSLNQKKVIKDDAWTQKDLLNFASIAFQLMEETLKYLDAYIRKKYSSS